MGWRWNLLPHGSGEPSVSQAGNPMKTLILAMLLLSSSANASLGLGSLTRDETNVYTETLRVLRAGAIDTVSIRKQQLLLRMSVIDESYQYVSTKKMPSAYQSAFSDLIERVDNKYCADLSPLARQGVALTDSMHFEPGICTLAFSPVGFGNQRQTAVVMVTSGCKDVPDASDGQLVVCLARWRRGWRATDYAVVQPSAWEEIARIFARDEEPDANTYSGFVERKFVLGSQCRVVVEVAGDRREYSGGSSIHLVWKDGVLFINGAARIVAQEIRDQADLVETVRVDSLVVEDERFERMAERFLSVKLRGIRDPEMKLTLHRTGSRAPVSPLVRKGEFYSWCRTFEHMTRQEARRTVEIVNGGVSISTER
jgi:hypothetical protein